MIGLPIWYVIGVLIALSEQFAGAIGVVGEVKAGTAIMYAYIGLSVGDLISGFLSQLIKSRRKVVFLYLAFSVLLVFLYLFSKGITAVYFNLLCFLLGIATGYWAIFVTMASEQFGTNVRSTVTTTVPNFVRGAVVPITLGFKYLSVSIGIIGGALIVGLICIILAFISVLNVKETFGKDLDYVEIM
jgi:MFS transporter, putative metabolite:H+ symporter